MDGYLTISRPPSLRHNESNQRRLIIDHTLETEEDRDFDTRTNMANNNKKIINMAKYMNHLLVLSSSVRYAWRGKRKCFVLFFS